MPSVVPDYSSSRCVRCYRPNLQICDQVVGQLDMDSDLLKWSRSRQALTHIYSFISTVSPMRIGSGLPYLSFPSKLAQQLALASYGTPILNTIVSGRMIGLKLNVCGEMAVTSMTGFSG